MWTLPTGVPDHITYPPAMISQRKCVRYNSGVPDFQKHAQAGGSRLILYNMVPVFGEYCYAIGGYFREVCSCLTILPMYCTIPLQRILDVFQYSYVLLCIIEPYPNESMYEASHIAALTYSYVLGSDPLYTPTRNRCQGRTFRCAGKASCSRQPSRQRAILSTVSVPFTTEPRTDWIQ
jgi:hypothetical protein